MAAAGSGQTVERGHPSIVNSLLDLLEARKAYNKALSTLKTLSLRPAAKRGHTKVVSILLILGSAPVTSLWEAIAVAVESEQLGIVILLIARAKEFGHVIDLHRALRIAVAYNHKGIVAYLASLRPFDTGTGSGLPILHIALEGRCWASVEVLLRSDNLNDNVNVEGTPSALHKAAMEGNLLVTKLLLLHKDIDVNLTYTASDRTPPQLSIEKGHLEVVAALLDHPRLVVNQYADRKTAIELAEKHGSWPIFELLLNREAQGALQHRVSDPRALQILLRRGELSSEQYGTLIDRLVKAGVISVNAKRSDGKTLLHHAAEEPDLYLM